MTAWISCGFAGGFRGGGRDDGIHELQSGFGSFGHLIFELPCGEARKAQKFGFLRAKLSETRDGVARVVGVAALGAVPGVLEDGLAGGAIAERNKVGLLSGVLQRNYKAFDLAVLGGLRGGRDARIGEAGQRGFVGGDVRAFFRGGEKFVGEGIRKRGDFFVEFLQFGLVGFGKIGAGVDELVVVVLDQAQRLRIELERGARCL